MVRVSQSIKTKEKCNMLYSLRIKLSKFFFRLGKNIHPDIARLTKEITEQQLRLGENKLIVCNKK
jgi:hypothetical protein